MIKNVLFIFVFEVEIKRLFFITRNVVTYNKNRFLEIIIENIMIFKKLYIQKKTKAKKNNNKTLIIIINVKNEIFKKDNRYTYILFLYTYILLFIHVHSIFDIHTLVLSN